MKPPEQEIAVRCVPGPRTLADQAAQSNVQGDAARSYDALIYARMGVPNLRNPKDAGYDPAGELAGLPLVGVENIRVRWGRYQEYLASFLEGAKDPAKMRYSLFETLSSGLEALFRGETVGGAPARIWWSSEAPELEDLPWELMIYGAKQPMPDLSFVRGQPSPTPIPVVPVGGPLRLALIHGSLPVPDWLRAVLNQLPAGIQLIDMPEEPRAALRRAAAEGYELVHLIADGIVSLAYEGILYLPGATPPELPPRELSSLLGTSRVTVLSIAQAPGLPDGLPLGGHTVPSFYRATAYLGRSPLPLPTIVAPIGPNEEWQLVPFWANFYHALESTLEVETAMSGGPAGQPPIAMAIYLRQSARRTFLRVEPQQVEVNFSPIQIQGDLLNSRQTVTELKNFESQYGELPDSVKQFLKAEDVRQSKLASDLSPWLKAGEE